MKKKLLYGILVASFVALVSINVNMGIGSHWGGIKLSAIESLADYEGPASGKRLESYLCWENIRFVPFQKVCKPFTRYPSECFSSEEEDCEDGRPGSGNNEWEIK